MGSPLGILSVAQLSCPSSFEKECVLNPKLLSSLWAVLEDTVYRNHGKKLADTLTPPEVTSLDCW